MAIPSDHLELSARLASHHRRRRPPAPRQARRGRWGARQRGSRLGRGRAFLGNVDARWQRSAVKASYSRNGRSASWGAHGTYLAREGAQRGGGKGRGFSAEQEGIDLPATLRSWQRAGDERLWKFIVSPEHAERLDLKAHSRALVSHMGRDSSGWRSITTTPTTRTFISSSAVGTPEAGASGSIPTTCARVSAGAVRTWRRRRSATARNERSCRREGTPSSGSTSQTSTGHSSVTGEREGS